MQNNNWKRRNKLAKETRCKINAIAHVYHAVRETKQNKKSDERVDTYDVNGGPVTSRFHPTYGISG